MMRNDLWEIIELVMDGNVKRADGDLTVSSQQFNVSVYRVGDIIRMDIKRVK